MTANLFLFTAFIVTQSLLALFAIAYVYSYIPIHWSVEIPKGLEPERESFFFILFLMVVVAITFAALRWLWPCWQRVEERVQWQKRLLIDGTILIILTVLFSKWVMYSHPFYPILIANDSGAWVNPLMATILIIAVIIKISWWVKLPQVSISVKIQSWQWLLAGGILFGILIFPQLAVLEPLSFMVDKFYHLDTWPVTRFLLLSGLDYTQTMLLLVLITLGMTGMLGVFVYRWLANEWLALGAMALFLKIGFFNYAQTPAPWINPATTPLAGCLDIIAYASWYSFVRRGGRFELVRAVIISVMAIWLSVTFHPWIQGPIYQALRVRQFWSFFMTFALAAFFTAIFCWSLIHYMRDRKREWLMPLVIAVGGWMSLFPVINQPAPGSYAWCALSMALLVSWQLSLATKRLKDQLLAIIFMVLSILGLLTNRVFLGAPHLNAGIYQPVVNQYKVVYWQESVRTINLYDPNKKTVALISPYEVMLSQRTHRQPYFEQSVIKKIDQIQHDGPCMVFIDRNWVTNPETMSQQLGLAAILDNVSRHYKPLAQQPQGLLTVWINNRESCLNR